MKKQRSNMRRSKEENKIWRDRSKMKFALGGATSAWKALICKIIRKQEFIWTKQLLIDKINTVNGGFFVFVTLAHAVEMLWIFLVPKLQNVRCGGFR